MVNLVERRLSSADIKALFRAIVAVRGAGGEGIATKSKQAAGKAKTMFANLKQKLTQSVEPDDLQRLRELAGITEAPSWAALKKKMQGAKDAAGRMIADKETVGIDDVFSAWHDAGSPDDLEEITQILNSLSFTGGEIKRALAQAGLSDNVDYDPKITNLAKAIKKEKLDGRVIKYLDSIGIKESINEKVLSNNAIRDIFTQIVDSLPTDGALELAPDPEDQESIAQNTKKEPELGDMNLQDSVDFDRLTNMFADVSIVLEYAQYGRSRKDGKH